MLDVVFFLDCLFCHSALVVATLSEDSHRDAESRVSLKKESNVLIALCLVEKASGFLLSRLLQKRHFVTLNLFQGIITY